MKIRTKLFLSAALTTSLVLTISGVLFFASQQLGKTFKENDAIDHLVRGIFALNILSHDYMLYHEDRAKEQWRMKHGAIRIILKNMVLKIPEEQAILETMIENHAYSESLFSKLEEFYKGGHPGLEDLLTAEVEKRLIGQLSVKLYAMVSNAEFLDEAIHTRLLMATQRTGWIVMSFVLIIAVIAMITSYLIGRAIFKPIMRLQEETAIIGSGNLNYRMETTAKDEIGELTRAFDRMTEKLKTTTVSRDELAREVIERKRAEEQIEASLKEKEVLLKEIHHRAKNNMQIIASLLKFQSDNIKEKQYADMFKESQDRIRSMALVHEKLYQSKDLANVDFNGYIRTFLNGLFRSHGVDTNKIALKIEVEGVSLEINTAIPCGLIINELVSNSLKYAFPEDRKGEIRIAFRSINEVELELIVSDDGVGIPEELDFRNTESLGLELVMILAEDQLEGKVELDRTNGTKYNILLKRQM